MAPDWRSLGVLALFSLGTLAAGTLSGLSAASAAEEYRDLDGPAWAPPPWVFGPVWTVLYLLVGAAAWLAWRAGAGRKELGLWGGQLALNLAWSPLFFGLGWRGVALVDIALLLAAIVATAAVFRRRDPWAAALLLPYLAWVTFATALNAAYWWMNR